MFTPLGTTGKLNLMLDLIAQKQRALSSNIANVDTPNYVRKDIDFQKYLGSMNSPLETKLSQTLGPSAVLEERENEKIVIADELNAMQQNSLMYTIATRRMSSIITQMKTAINVGK